MKNILVIGGTKYLGLELIKLLEKSKINFFVASRKEIEVKNFIKIDRKNQKDLDQLFSHNQFDVVVDFINYSGLDSKLLLNSIRKQSNPPKLILISTVYTYAMPMDIDCDSFFKEASFNPLEYDNSMIDRPQVSYAQGKRDMESYCAKNYSDENLVILRFPIVLGADDYTRRTHFYIDIIKNSIQINPKNLHKKSCYVFVDEAANSVFNFIKNEKCGIYNVSHEAISEYDLIKLFSDYFHCSIDSLISSSVNFSNTPFSTNFDFIVDATRYNSIYPNMITFETALKRVISKIR